MTATFKVVQWNLQYREKDVHLSIPHKGNHGTSLIAGPEYIEVPLSLCKFHRHSIIYGKVQINPMHTKTQQTQLIFDAKYCTSPILWCFHYFLMPQKYYFLSATLALLDQNPRGKNMKHSSTLHGIWEAISL